MNDRSWMLSAQAIRAARECINIVKEELGIKLTLSHSDFLYMLYEYVELTDSIPLADAYANLLSLAGEDHPKLRQKLKNAPNKKQKVVPILEDEHKTNLSEEWVSFKGKEFPRWSHGKEFKGLYRGQPRYA